MQTSEMPTVAEVTAWAHALYADAVDRKEAAGFAAVFTEDAWMRFGNAEPIVGRDAIQAAIAHFFSLFSELRHEFKGVWYQDSAAILEAIVTYKRFDGSEVSVPAVTIFRFDPEIRLPMKSAVAHRCQMYVDLTPLFA